MKRKSTSKALLSYSAMAAGFLAVPNLASAAVVYTDVDPDVVLINGTYDIDFDGDGSIELQVNQNGYFYSASSYGYSYISSYQVAMLSGWTPGFDFMGQAGAGYPLSSVYFVNALNSGEIIGSTGVFAGYSYGYLGGRGYYAAGGFSTVVSYGFWNNVTDKYAGVRFLIGTDVHYGWIRCDVGPNFNQVTLKSFAYETVAGAPIFAGDTVGVAVVPADVATSLVLSDVADNANGLDLQLDFTKAADEAKVDEYRLLVVQSADAPGFTLADALAVPSTNYLSLSPTGSDVMTNFGVSGRDVNGIFITEGVPYRAFVLSMADGVNANVNALSAVSNEVTLSTFSAPADIALSVTAVDNADFGDGRDVLVSFDPATDETTVADYRVIIVKESSAAGFDATTAAGLSGDRVKSLAPTGAAIMTSLSATSEDADGDIIQEGVSYQAFVVSMPDGINATDPTLATPSLPFTLSSSTGLTQINEVGIKVASQANTLAFQADPSLLYTVQVFSLNGSHLTGGRFAGNGSLYSHLWDAGEIVLVQIQLTSGEQKTLATPVLIR